MAAFSDAKRPCGHTGTMINRRNLEQTGNLMIGYVMLGSNDLPRAIAFYDALLAGLGATRGFSHERFQFYVTGNQAAPSLAICTPHDGQVAVPGNGTMVALAAPRRAVVN